MLSSRYLYLHEALELGVMWLKQGAKVRPSGQTAGLPAKPPAEAAIPKPAVSPDKRPENPGSAVAGKIKSGGSAREAVLAAVGSYRPPVAETVSATKPQAEMADDYRRRMQGLVAPAVIMAVSVCPSPADVLAGRPLSGGDGVLFDKMLAAISLQPADAHRTFWLEKLSFSFVPEQMAASLPRLQAERDLCAARAILLLDRYFGQPEQSDLLEKMCGGLPCFIIPHPATLLSHPALKREAWETLQKLRDVLDAV